MATLDPASAQVVTAAEAGMKKALTEGIAGVTAGPLIAPASNYSPASAPTVAQDANRCIAAGIVEALRGSPMRVPVMMKAQLPNAGMWAGGLVIASDGATSGGSMLVFSNGVFWIRCDDGSQV